MKKKIKLLTQQLMSSKPLQCGIPGFAELKTNIFIAFIHAFIYQEPRMIQKFN